MSGARARTAWVLFDWAVQPYHTLITAFIFGPYFAAELIGETARGQAVWGYVQSVTGLAVALAAPVIGTLAGRSGRLKEFLFAFSLAYVAATTLLWGAVSGAVWLAIVAVTASGFFIEMATVLTNAMLPGLARPGRIGALSGSAWAFGFVGGLISLGLTLAFFAPLPGGTTTIAGLTPAFGLTAADGGPARATGPLAAVWYVIFAAPLFFWVPAAVTGTPDQSRRIIDSFRDLVSRRGLLVFFAARLAYQDALLAVFAFGGIYAAGLLGWGTTELGLFGILLTVAGIAGAFAGGRLDDRFGGKSVVAASIVTCLVSLAIIAMLERPPAPAEAMFSRPADQGFLAAGTLIGIAAGPLQASSRSYLARLAPRDEIATYFGIYAFSGKAVSFTGPFLVALATDFAGSQRAGLVPIAGLFAIGFVVLLLAPSDRARTAL